MSPGSSEHARRCRSCSPQTSCPPIGARTTGSQTTKQVMGGFLALQDPLPLDTSRRQSGNRVLVIDRHTTAEHRPRVRLRLEQTRQHLVLVRRDGDGLPLPVQELLRPQRNQIHLRHSAQGDRQRTLRAQKFVELLGEVRLQWASALFDRRDLLLADDEPLAQRPLREPCRLPVEGEQRTHHLHRGGVPPCRGTHQVELPARTRTFTIAHPYRPPVRPCALFHDEHGA